MMNSSESSTKKTLFDAFFYLVAYAVIQVFLDLVGGLVFSRPDQLAVLTVTTTLASSVLTVALFVWRGWSPFSRTYIQTRPWALLMWVVCLAVGLIVPLQLLQEGIGIDMPEQYKTIFTQMMTSDWGLLAAAVAAPVVEEVVFRGAILRRLLQCHSLRGHWMAIAITALAFAVMHGNLAQGLNALLIGLLLGWLYYRTGSIVPGLAMHIAINTCSTLVMRLMPQTVDMTLIQLYGGSTVRIALSVVFSLAICGAAFYQICRELKK